MSKIESSNVVDCLTLSSDEINYRVKELLCDKHRKIVLKNTDSKSGLLNCIKASAKIEIFGNVSSDFANNISGLKVIVNGNVGENSANNIEDSKIVIFGSCSNNFANGVKSGEIYILDACGANSLIRLSGDSKAVVGGPIGNGFAASNEGGTVVGLNLKGGNLFVEEHWFKDFRSGFVYLRGEENKVKLLNNNWVLESANYNNDEDIYLPLISEFSRLFNISLSEIKSKPFNRITFK